MLCNKQCVYRNPPSYEVIFGDSIAHNILYIELLLTEFLVSAPGRGNLHVPETRDVNMCNKRPCQQIVIHYFLSTNKHIISMAPTRSHMTLDTKYKAILEVENGVMKKEVAAKFGIPPSTLSTWLKGKAAIKARCESGTVGPKAMAMKAGRFEKTEQAILQYILEARAANIEFTGTIIKIKAEQFAKKLGEHGFCGSNGWLDRFKRRHCIKLKSVKGEANSVDTTTVDEFRAGVGASLPQRYAPVDIFNADETALFWLITAGKTLTFKHDPCIGTKQNKSRVTILPCVNMTGTEKKQLLIIGRYENPRCMKGRKHKLKCTYTSNTKAWMTSTVFTEWLTRWNRKLSREGRHIALVLDNAPCHPKITLTHIELVFLPPNTTSHTQPLDQGIIANMKSHYRHLYTLGHLLPAMEAGVRSTYNLFDALGVVTQAWGLVTPRTIARCFRRAGFKHPNITEPTPEEDEEENLPLTQLATRLTSVGIPCDTAEVNRILTEEEGLQTHGISTDDEIANAVLPQEEEEIEQTEVDPVPTKPSHREFLAAMEHLKVLQVYASFDDAPEMDDLSELLLKVQTMCIRHEPKKRQTTLHQFFAPRE